MNKPLCYAILLAIGWALPALAAATERIQVRDQNGQALAGAVVLLPDSNPVENMSMRYVVDQVDRQFQPQILAIPVNSTVEFPNSDDVRHHVYSFSEVKTFELRLYHADEADPVIFDRAGIVKIGCNIHDQMRAYLLVTNRKQFGYTDAQGDYLLPAGSTAVDTIEVWYPPMEAPLSVALENANGAATVTLPVQPLAQTRAESTSSLEQRLKRYKRDAQ